MAPEDRPDETGSAGFTLIEISIALAGLAVVATMLMTVFVGANKVDDLHTSDDTALEQLREARQRMSRDVREARRFTSIGSRDFTVWVDEGWDEVIGSGELITWTIYETGDLVRSTDFAERVEASGVSYADSWFGFDATVAASVTRMEIHLAAPVESGLGGTRTLDTEITLRNVP
jgi:type II secretory pathway pseudopilin PulG